MTQTPKPTHSTDAMSQCIQTALAQYFNDLDGESPCAIYDMVIKCIERPLLIDVLARVSGNQSKAAEWLGINRNTLRKKMKEHGLD